MTFSQAFYGIIIPLIIFLISFFTTLLLYIKFSKDIKGKETKKE